MKENIKENANESVLSENLTEDQKIEELKRRNKLQKNKQAFDEFMANIDEDEKENAFNFGHLDEEEEFKSPFELDEEEKLPRNYANYVKLHTGDNRFKYTTLEEKATAVGRCFAAMNLESNKQVFDVQRTRIHGEKNVEFYELRELDEKTLDKALESKESLEKFRAKRTNEMYSTQKGKEELYIEKMKALHRNMMSKSGRSPEYKDYYDAVERIASLKPTDDKFQAKLTVYNKELVRSMRDYYYDKKKVRWSENGQKRFNNLLDGMAIVDGFVPGAGGRMQTMVVDINLARNATNYKNVDKYIELKNFGADRAVLNPDPKNVRELAEKEEKLKKQKEKKLEEKKLEEKKLGDKSLGGLLPN